MKKAAIKVFQKSQVFYSKYSHPTGLALSSIMMFDGSDNIVLGGHYDEHKSKGYEKEFSFRASMAGSVPNVVAGIEANGNWESEDPK